MPRQTRFLSDGLLSPSPPSDTVDTVDSDFVLILAVLLCALICTLGLVAVARCAWLRRFSSRHHQPPQPQPSSKGLNKKIIRVLPKHTFSKTSSNTATECPICLAEFADGDELRALPLCGHQFHAACVDTWLFSHSSCPSCRRILVVDRCEHCGQFASASDPSTSSNCSATKERVAVQIDDNRFLP